MGLAQCLAHRGCSENICITNGLPLCLRKLFLGSREGMPRCLSCAKDAEDSQGVPM